MALTSLDFLGFGLPPGSPSLGELLNQGKTNLQAPWLGITSFFMIAVMLTLLVFVGEAVRDAFDPRKHSPMNDTAPSCVRELSVTFDVDRGRASPRSTGPFELRKGETLALVGESGSGKSVTALSILQLLPYPLAKHPAGSSISSRARSWSARRSGRLRGVRGNRIAMIFQEPMTSLNPLHTIEKQIGEMLEIHKGLTGAAARARIIELLRLVGLAPRRRNASTPTRISFPAASASA